MNRLLGTLFAVATIAAIAFAILNYGNYTSMLQRPEAATITNILEEEEVIEPDSTAQPIDIVEIATEPINSETEE